MPTPDMLLLLAIILLVLGLFISELLPIPVTALLGAALLMVTGLLTPEEALSGFSSRATITVLAVFVLSAGLERTGGVHWLTRALLAWAGQNRRRQVGVLGLLVGPVSGFINNTAVVAVMLPATMRLARESGAAPSKLLIPLSNLAMLGGTLTIIGTSTNLLGNTVLANAGFEPFSFFEFVLVGAVALAVGLVYFMTIGVHVVPDRGGRTTLGRFDLKGFLAEYRVPPDALVVGRSLQEAGLTRAEGLQVVRLVRGDVVHGAPEDEAIIRVQADDVLLVKGSRERLEALPDLTGVEPRAATHAPTATADEPVGDDAQRPVTAEVIIAPGSRLAGRTLAEVRFLQSYKALVLAVRHHGRVAMGPLAETRLAVGDVLLVQASSRALDSMAETPDVVITRERGRTTYRIGRLPVAIGIMAVVVGLAAFGVLPIVTTALLGAVAMVVAGCLRMDEFLGAVRWDVVLLLAGVIPLGIAFEQTGAAALLAAGLVQTGAGLDLLPFLVVLFIVTTVTTEIISNNAAAVLLIPVAIQAALSLGADPRAFALTVMLAASTSMLTPVGYQTNTMVYAPGHYRFLDFARVAFPLNLALAFLVPLTILLVFP